MKVTIEIPEKTECMVVTTISNANATEYVIGTKTYGTKEIQELKKEG